MSSILTLKSEFFLNFLVLTTSFFKIILYSLGLVRWWTANFEQVPDTILYDWCSYILISTLLAIELPVAQWVEHPHLNSEGREFDSHLELGIFLSFLVLKISFFQIFTMKVNPYRRLSIPSKGV